MNVPCYAVEKVGSWVVIDTHTRSIVFDSAQKNGTKQDCIDWVTEVGSGEIRHAKSMQPIIHKAADSLMAKVKARDLKRAEDALLSNSSKKRLGQELNNYTKALPVFLHTVGLPNLMKDRQSHPSPVLHCRHYVDYIAVGLLGSYYNLWESPASGVIGLYDIAPITPPWRKEHPSRCPLLAVGVEGFLELLSKELLSQGLI